MSRPRARLLPALAVRAVVLLSAKARGTDGGAVAKDGEPVDDKAGVTAYVTSNYADNAKRRAVGDEPYPWVVAFSWTLEQRARE